MHHCTKSVNDKLRFYEKGTRVKAEYYLSKYPDTNTDRDCQTVEQRLKRLAELKQQVYRNQDDERIGQCQTQLEQCNERVHLLESQIQEFKQQCKSEKQILETGKNDIHALYDGLVQESQQNKEVRDNLQLSLEEAVLKQTSLQTELGNMKKVSGEFIKDIERLNKERKTLQTELSEVVNTRDTLIGAASSSDMEMKSLRNELDARKETIARIQLEKDELTDEIQVLKEAAKRGEIDTRTLNEQLAAIRSEMDKLQTEHSSKVQELNTLREQYETVVKQTGLDKQRIQELDVQFNDCESKREELVKSLKSSKDTSGTLGVDLANKEIEYNALLKEHTAAQTELSVVKKERDDALLQLRNGMGERDELRENLRLKNEEVSKCRTDVQELQLKIEGLTSTNSQVQTAWNEASGKVNQLNALIAEKALDYQKSLDTLQKSVERLTGELNQAKDDCQKKISQISEKCQTEKDELNARIRKLEEDLQESKVRNDNLQQVNTAMGAKLKELKAAHENCQKTLDESKLEAQKLSEAFAKDIANKNTELSATKDALDEQKRAMQNTFDKLKDEFDAQAKLIEELKTGKTASVTEIERLRQLSNNARGEAENLLNEKLEQIRTLESRIQENTNMSVDDRIAELGTKIRFYKQYTDATKAKLQAILDEFPKKVVSTSASRASYRA